MAQVTNLPAAGFLVLLLFPAWVVGQAGQKEPEYKGVPLTKWIAQLKSTDPDKKSEAIDAIRLIGPAANSAIPVLIPLLQDPDEEIAEEVVRTLAGIGPGVKQAVAAVTIAMNDKRAAVRIQAAAATWKLDPGNKAVVPTLIKGLMDKRVRQSAAIWLGEVGPAARDAAPALADLLRDEDESMAEAAAKALSKIRPRDPKLIRALAVGLEKGFTIRQDVISVFANFAPDAKEAVPHLIKALATDHATAYVLIRYGETALPALLEALQNPDPELRRNAALALGHFGPAAERVIPALIPLLADGNDAVRSEAAEALGRFGPVAKDAAPKLAKLVQSGEIGFRRAGMALAQIGPAGKAAIPDLLLALKHENQFVQIAAAEGLTGVVGPDAKDAVPALVAALKDTHSATRWYATIALGKIGPTAKDAVPHLILQLKNREFKEADFPLRSSAARALGRISPEARAAIPDLIQALGDKETGVSSAAGNGLAGIGVVAIPALLDAIKGPDADIRREAVFVVAHMGPSAKDAVAALIGVLPDKDSITREAAAWALGKIGPDAKAAVADLTKLLDRDEPEVVVSAAVVLLRIEPDNKKAVSTLVQMLKHKNAYLALCALRDLGERGAVAKEAIPAVAEVFQRSKENWLLAAEVLAKLGPAGVAQLEAALKNKNPEVRVYAARELGRMGPAAVKAVPDLVANLKDESPSVRQSAMYALGRIGKPAAAAAKDLLKALSDPDPELRLAAALALGRISAPKDALPVLIAAVGDGNLRAFNEALLAEALGCYGPDARQAVPDLLDLYHGGLSQRDVAAALYLIDRETSRKALIAEPK